VSDAAALLLGGTGQAVGGQAERAGRSIALNDLNVCIERGDPNINVYIQADSVLMQSGEWARIIDMWTAFIDRNPESGSELLVAFSDEGFGPGIRFAVRYYVW
jgi:hypothetical protein